MTQNLWEDHSGAYFILAKIVVRRMDVSTSTSHMFPKNKLPATGARMPQEVS